MSGWWVQALPDWFAGFAWPWMLAALPLPWLVRWLAPPVRSTTAALRVPWTRRLAAIDVRSGAAGARAMPVLAWLAWTLLCVAAARPQQHGDVVRPPQSGRDLMLAVDLSGSMLEEDMRLGGRVVDRLTAAKAVLADFLDRREGDRVGLLVFGQRAYALAPLTLDRDTVRDQLLDSVVGLAGRETAIGDAIGLAVKRLDAQSAQQRVLVLLTDGVNTSGLLDPLKAADIARTRPGQRIGISAGKAHSRVSASGQG
jgi:Ca-activated chloride channel family protein